MAGRDGPLRIVADRSAIAPPVAVMLEERPLPALPGAALIASEAVLLLTARLPVMAAAQRATTVAFAVEDRVAVPLEQVHVALGPQIAPGEWLVGVIDRAALAAPAAAARAEGLRLVPDVMAVPAPTAGAWSVWCLGARILVRLPDGTGFATSASDFAAFWAAGGRPSVVHYAGTLPPGIGPVVTGLPPDRPEPLAQVFDLATGPYARASSALRRALWQGAALIIAALCLLTGLRGLDALAFHRIAVSREAEVRQALTAAGQPEALDPATALARAMAAASPAGAGGFLPLMAEVSGLLAAGPATVSLRSLGWTDAGGQLTLAVEGADLAALQGVEARLRAAGLGVTSGAATTGDGGAQMRLIVQRGAP